MENVFRTRSETANRDTPDNFPLLFFGFDASGARITSEGISCSESFQLLEILNEIFIFEIFDFSIDGLSVDHRWESLHVILFSLTGGQWWVTMGCQYVRLYIDCDLNLLRDCRKQKNVNSVLAWS